MCTLAHTNIGSVLHNAVSDGSWGQKNAAFGICPVKVGQREKSGEWERKQRGTDSQKNNTAESETEREGGW